MSLSPEERRIRVYSLGAYEQMMLLFSREDVIQPLRTVPKEKQKLKLRTTPPSAESLVVTGQAFTEADGVLREAGVRWHNLRDYFNACFMMLSTPQIPSVAVHFMLGHAVEREARKHFMRSFFNQGTIRSLRELYVRVEKKFFV
jgi:hypothetical protein